MTRTGYKAMRGFSLVELMISVALGLIVVTAITSLTVKSLDSSNDLARMTRLEQELRGILQVMTRDLKRAGFMNYQGLVDFIGNGPAYNNPFQTFEVDDLGDSAGIIRCVSYSYDRNDDGVLDANETYGFSYDTANNEIDALSGNCASAGEAISDNSRVLITDLRFVVNFTDEELENTHIEPLPPAGTGSNAHIIQRQVLISITGRLSDDASVTRTLHESVKLRNHEFTPPS